MTVTPEEASDAGQATIEHTETLFEGTFSAAMNDQDRAGAIRRFRSDAADKLFARFAANKTVVDPTLVAYRAILLSSDPSAPPDPRDRYVAQSLTPLQALQAATSNPAKVLNATADFGTVEAGRRADLVLLDGNPLEDLRNTQRIAAVVFGGKLLRRSDLDALLAGAEQ